MMEEEEEEAAELPSPVGLLCMWCLYLAAGDGAACSPSPAGPRLVLGAKQNVQLCVFKVCMHCTGEGWMEGVGLAGVGGGV